MDRWEISVRWSVVALFSIVCFCSCFQSILQCSPLSALDSMLILALLYCTMFSSVVAIELTFELPDNANQCFFEEMKAGVDSVIEFQVVTGGKYDVDMTLEDPNGKVLYKDVKKQYDSYSWKTAVDGAYKACFSNEFSTFTHKIVYMDWQKGDEGMLKTTPRLAAMSQMETSASGISDRLRLIDDYQTHHRLREATGRKRAEDLNERVMLWSMGQTIVILLIGIAQVIKTRYHFWNK